jgi:hypothetical protein
LSARKWIWFWACASIASTSGAKPARCTADSCAEPVILTTAVISLLGLATWPTAAIISSEATAWSCSGIDCSATARPASSVMPLAARPKAWAFSRSARHLRALRMIGTRLQTISPPSCVLIRRSAS